VPVSLPASSFARRQGWVGGGIGITPFIARMKALAVEPDGRSSACGPAC
jgi:predicted ferric reductase